MKRSKKPSDQNAFQGALRRAILREGRASDFSRKVNIDVGSLSLWLHGKRYPLRDNLDELLKRVDEETRLDMLAAVMDDAIPPSCRKLVRVIVGGVERTVPKEPRSEAEHVLERLAVSAKTNPAVEGFLEYWGRLMG